MAPQVPEEHPPALPPQNTRRCVCHAGYVGDGLQCLEEPEPPVDRCLGQPPPCHVDAVCTDFHFQGVLPCPPPVALLALGATGLITCPSLLQRSRLGSSTSRPPVVPMA